MSTHFRPSASLAILSLGLVAAMATTPPSNAATVSVGPDGWCSFTNLTDAVVWAEATDDGPHTIDLVSGSLESEAPILVHLSRGAQKRVEPIEALAPHRSELVG